MTTERQWLEGEDERTQQDRKASVKLTADLSVLLDQLKGHAETAARTEALTAVDPQVVAALADVAAAADRIQPDCGICNGGVTIEDYWPDGLCPMCGEVAAAVARLRLVFAGEEES